MHQRCKTKCTSPSHKARLYIPWPNAITLHMQGKYETLYASGVAHETNAVQKRILYVRGSTHLQHNLAASSRASYQRPHAELLTKL